MVKTLPAAPLAAWLAAAVAASLCGASSWGDEPAAAAVKAPLVRPPYAGARSQRGERYYAHLYGVDQLRVRSTSSGESLEFRYRVVDPQKAAVLGDKRAKPVLVDQKTGARLTVPTMEKIGELRQTSALEAGREYWMIFANPGKLVKPGQRVDIVVGAFRISSLTVE
jgi:hypothetical protein